ncbi:MAG: hypothetical protein KZQ58_01845 [gamma proteobacterium symbiont of Bathyaustriella thionipta]|nr:hypothetical protein [gamma proteobacterium symbiont of Bathyaustriella thionipta]
MRNRLSVLMMAVLVLLLSACGDDKPAQTKVVDKPQHIWSTQVEALSQAKEAAKYANEKNAQDEKRLKEIGL